MARLEVDTGGRWRPMDETRWASFVEAKDWVERHLPAESNDPDIGELVRGMVAPAAVSVKVIHDGGDLLTEETVTPDPERAMYAVVLGDEIEWVRGEGE